MKPPFRGAGYTVYTAFSLHGIDGSGVRPRVISQLLETMFHPDRLGWASATIPKHMLADLTELSPNDVLHSNSEAHQC